MTFRRLVYSVLIIIVSLVGATGCDDRQEEGLPPVVSFTGSKVIRIALGESRLLSPSFDHLTDRAVIRWILDGTVVGSAREYTFSPAESGVYYLTVEVSTKWGSDADELRFEVYEDTPEPEPVLPSDRTPACFPQHTYNVSEGRTIRILPFDLDSTLDLRCVWMLGDTVVQDSDDPLYRFEARQQGVFDLTFQLRHDGAVIFTDTVQVNVCPPEGTYRRPAGAASSPYAACVHEFLPAPGQYVNENYTALTMEEACAYAFSRICAEQYVSLGGFGGSLVVGFDHSIDNDGDYSFAIRSALTANGSEPGIVWVMQDENGNGLPDDTWYEVKGSEYGLEGTVQDYAVTYYRPSGPALPVVWTDNRSGSGRVEYMAAFHKQDSYYPLWVEEERYTLRGTRLETRNYDSSGTGTMWVLPDRDWGYADNHSDLDMLPERAAGITAGCNHFKISDAVTFDGQPARLQYIDFIKVQTGLNGNSGWLGEISTEVAGFIDFNMVK